MTRPGSRSEGTDSLGELGHQALRERIKDSIRGAIGGETFNFPIFARATPSTMRVSALYNRDWPRDRRVLNTCLPQLIP
jgi:hypothetical protein